MKAFPIFALLALLLAFGGLTLSRNHHAKANARHGECVAAVAIGEAGAGGRASVCEKPIIEAAALADAGRAAGVCEAGLEGLKAGAPMACTQNVRRLAADRDARAAEVANLREQLAQARTESAAAVDRAVRRERTANQRKADAQAAIAAAPRDAHGLSVYDADRLCQLVGCDSAR